MDIEWGRWVGHPCLRAAGSGGTPVHRFTPPLAFLEKQLGLGRVLEQQLHLAGDGYLEPQDVSHMVLLAQGWRPILLITRGWLHWKRTPAASWKLSADRYVLSPHTRWA